MATDNSKGQAFTAWAASLTDDNGDDEGATPSKPLFSPYAPFSEALDGKRIPGSRIRLFASSVYRMAGGCQVLTELLAQEASDDARRLMAGSPPTPVLLNAFHRGQLHSLISACLENLTHQAEHLADWAETHCTHEA